MLKLTGLSLLAFLFVIALTPVSMTSCTKTNTYYDTVTVTKVDTLTDTVTIKDTVVSAAVLTANSWKLQELHGVKDNTITYYLRGGSNNTESFDNEYIVFKADYTGNYVTNTGGTATLTWSFSDASNTSLQYTLTYSSGPVETIYWENMTYKDGALHYDEYYSDDAGNSYSSATRIPK